MLLALIALIIICSLCCMCMSSKQLPRHTPKLDMPYITGTAQAGFQNESSDFPKSQWQQYVNIIHPHVTSPEHINLKILRDDLIRLKSMGGNTYRLSVEWARVSPTFYEYDMSYYVNVCRMLKELELKPVITLFHFVLAPWAINVWSHSQPWFIQFGKKVINTLAQYNPMFITLNEPYLYALHGYITGSRPPFKKSAKTGLVVLKNMLCDHAVLYRYCKASYPHILVSIAKNFMPVHADCAFNPIEQVLRYQFQSFFNQSYYNFVNTGIISFFLLGSRIKHDTGVFPVVDFIGINHYCEITFTTGISEPVNIELRPRQIPSGSVFTEAGWFATPHSWFKVIDEVTQNVNLPIIITECGVSQAQESEITREIVMQNILNTFNLFPQVQGTLVWTLVDNVEWESGSKVKFGIFNSKREPTETFDCIQTFFKSKVGK